MKLVIRNKINKNITANEVRLIAVPIGHEIGIYSYYDAMKIARDNNLDLIQISDDHAKPVICKIMEISKFNYDQKQKEKANKKSQKGGQTKELRLSWDIGVHDMDVKAKKATEFLQDGNKVKVTILFRGRQNIYTDKGQVVMLKFAGMLSEVGIPEQMPKFEGKQCSFIIKPIAKK